MMRAVREDMVLHVEGDVRRPVQTDRPAPLRLAIVYLDISSYTPITEVMGDAVAAKILERFSELGARGGRALRRHDRRSGRGRLPARLSRCARRSQGRGRIFQRNVMTSWCFESRPRPAIGQAGARTAYAGAVRSSASARTSRAQPLRPRAIEPRLVTSCRSGSTRFSGGGSRR